MESCQKKTIPRFNLNFVVSKLNPFSIGKIVHNSPYGQTNGKKQ